MGSALGPLMADTFMCSIEEKLESDDKLPSFYKRYLNDTRGGWTRAELHYGSTLQYASVHTSSHAVRTPKLTTEDPLKLEFLSSFRCKCRTLNVILLHNSSDYLTNTCRSMKT